jgi:hypothetical protein
MTGFLDILRSNNLIVLSTVVVILHTEISINPNLNLDSATREPADGFGVLPCLRRLHLGDMKEFIMQRTFEGHDLQCKGGSSSGILSLVSEFQTASEAYSQLLQDHRCERLYDTDSGPIYAASRFKQPF